MQETRNNCFGSKNVARSFFRRKQLSTSAEPEEGSCYVFRPETIVASFLHSMVLIPKVLFNHYQNAPLSARIQDEPAIFEKKFPVTGIFCLEKDA